MNGRGYWKHPLEHHLNAIKGWKGKPHFMKPMLAQSDDEHRYLGDKKYIAQRKLDGERLLSIKHGKSLKLWNRRKNEKSGRFPEIKKDLSKIPHNYILDGEVYYLGKGGKEEFTPVQRRSSTSDPIEAAKLKKEYPLRYGVFDILYLNGYDLRNVPYEIRHKIINHLLNKKDKIYPMRTISNTKNNFKEACRKNWEGLIVKNVDSVYEPGKRSRAWQKEKCWKEDTAQVIGVTEGTGKRSDLFGALILGKKKNGSYHFVGNVGTGFTDDNLKYTLEMLSKVKTKIEPRIINEERMDGNNVKFWVKPKYEADVRYGEITKYGIYRFPQFVRMKEV